MGDWNLFTRKERSSLDLFLTKGPDEVEDGVDFVSEPEADEEDTARPHFTEPQELGEEEDEDEDSWDDEDEPDDESDDE